MTSTDVLLAEQWPISRARIRLLVRPSRLRSSWADPGLFVPLQGMQIARIPCERVQMGQIHMIARPDPIRAPAVGGISTKFGDPCLGSRADVVRVCGRPDQSDERLATAGTRAGTPSRGRTAASARQASTSTAPDAASVRPAPMPTISAP